MKSLNIYINETLACSHSEHINEWKASADNVSSIKKTPYFIYRNDEKGQIKIFDNDWVQINEYKDKVYINKKHVELDNNGWTTESYEPGTYYVKIKNIDNVINCRYMFWSCTDLVKVPLFDTSKVKDMYGMFSNCINIKDVPLFNTNKVKTMEQMFWGCINLEEVPLFDISKVKYIEDIFWGCNNLSEKTIQEWSSVYDFEIHNKR